MCGICFMVSDSPSMDPAVSELLDRRGPDQQRCHAGRLSPQLEFVARGCVLWMRGDAVTPQPVISRHGDLLLWNGNMFDGITLADGVSDTSRLAALLSGASERTVLSTLSAVCGPWAFVLWQAAERRLWFGRDPLGRRSLLWDGSAGRLGRSLTLTSVGGRHRPELSELPCLGVFSVHVPADCGSCAALQPRLHAWQHVQPPPQWRLAAETAAPLQCAAQLRVNPAVPDAALQTLLDSGGGLDEAARLPGMAAAIVEFEAAMLAAVRRRVANMPEECSTCLPSRVAGNSRAPCRHAKLAVLFSGGVDSMLVAALADRCLPDAEAVDLVNVAFERPARPQGGSRGRPPATETPEYEVPDRVTGRDGWMELRRINPRRQWNFVQVNVTAAELCEWRVARVRHLISPLQTVLDDSIGCAVWFAARGAGVLAGDDSPRQYQSRARVVLVGMGADEQLAGYGRHRSAFQRQSWPGLLAEIQAQLLAICERNLGRDDRVISDHGREARFPFLDEAVISLLSSLPVWLKAQLAPCWSGCDKLPIRLLTARCGAPAAATRAKRAIQFGSRIAKLENRTEKAADVCSRLTETVVSNGDVRDRTVAAPGGGAVADGDVRDRTVAAPAGGAVSNGDVRDRTVAAPTGGAVSNGDVRDRTVAAPAGGAVADGDVRDRTVAAPAGGAVSNGDVRDRTVAAPAGGAVADGDVRDRTVAAPGGGAVADGDVRDRTVAAPAGGAVSEGEEVNRTAAAPSSEPDCVAVLTRPSVTEDEPAARCAGAAAPC